MGAVPRLKTSLCPRCRQYSDINAAAIPLAQITAAPKTALRENPSGYVLVRHNNTAVSARADGQCAGEALHFASGRKELGDAVEAAPRRTDGGTAFDDMDNAVKPWGFRLYALSGFNDGAPLTFADLFRSNMQGIAVCETIVEKGFAGGLATHYIVADFWRRLIFLGAGELSLQWLAGLIRVSGNDRHLLDERMGQLRIKYLIGVRMLVEHSPRVRATQRPGRNSSSRAKRKRQFF